jgi:hypothetical protein
VTPQEQLQLVQLVESVRHRFRLDQFETAALKRILSALDQANAEILAMIEARASGLQDWREERALALLDEYSDLQLALKAQLGQSISEITGIAGANSYLVHNDILSFGGLIKDFNNVSLTASQLQAMAQEVPVGGKLLSSWIDDAFGASKEAIQQEIMAGMLQGEGYPGLVRRFAQGWDMTREDATLIARSYTQAINVQAAHDVAVANKESFKGWKWQSAAENGAYYTKSGKGRGRGVCLLCLSLDASDTIYPLNGGPEIPAHVKCRCNRQYITKSWRELGIPVDEIEKASRPYTQRGKGIDPETGEIAPLSVGTGGRPILDWGHFLGDYEDFFKLLTPAVQKQTIGPMRLELYNSGKIKGLGDLVTIENGKARLLLLKELKGD